MNTATATHPSDVHFTSYAGHDWSGRHNFALCNPKRHEEVLLSLCRTAKSAAVEWHEDAYGSENVVAPLIRATRAALNFDAGRLDCGTLDGALCRLAELCNLDPDNL